jgi:hypothetical protein
MKCELMSILTISYNEATKKSLPTGGNGNGFPFLPAASAHFHALLYTSTKPKCVLIPKAIKRLMVPTSALREWPNNCTGILYNEGEA